MSRLSCTSSVPHRPHRHSPRKPGRFGAGLTYYAGQHDGRKAYSEDDIRWAAAVFNQVFDCDTIADQRAAEAEMRDKIEAGFRAF